jgi:hypothetical protein
VDKLKLALESLPCSSTILYHLSNAQMTRAKYNGDNEDLLQSALETVEKLLSYYPSNLGALEQKANIYWLVLHTPPSPSPFLFPGLFLVLVLVLLFLTLSSPFSSLLKRWHEAVEVYKVIILEAKNQKDIRCLWGRALLELNDFASAIKQFDEALAIAPKDVQVLLESGTALLQLAQTSPAGESLLRLETLPLSVLLVLLVLLVLVLRLLLLSLPVNHILFTSTSTFTSTLLTPFFLSVLLEIDSRRLFLMTRPPVSLSLIHSYEALQGESRFLSFIVFQVSLPSILPSFFVSDPTSSRVFALVQTNLLYSRSFASPVLPLAVLT